MQLIIRNDAGGETVHQILPPGATLGRGSANHIVLPDSSGHISLTQALVSMTERGQVMLKNLASQPLLVNQQPLEFGQTCALDGGHSIQIGSYVCTVSGLQPERVPTVLPMPGGSNVTGYDQPRESSSLPTDEQRSTATASDDIASLIASASAPAQQARPSATTAAAPLFDHLQGPHSGQAASQPAAAQTDIFASLLGGDALPVGSSALTDLHPFEQKSRIDNPYHDPLQNLSGDVKFEEEKDPLKVLSNDGSEHLKADIFSNMNPSTLNTANTSMDLTELDRLLEELNKKP